MVKLWKVKVNNWGWDYPATIYTKSREDAEKESEKYPVSDRVEYAGMFTEEKAKRMLSRDPMEEYIDMYRN